MAVFESRKAAFRMACAQDPWKKIFYFYNSSSFYLFKLIGLTGVSVLTEIKRFDCMTPISVSRKSITKCLCSALNVCPSAIICRLLSSKYFKKPRTAVSIDAATATICNLQCVQQRSPGPDRWY